MNIDKTAVTTKLNTVLVFCQRHALVLGFALFALLYGYIIIQATSLTSKTPDEAAVAEQIKAVPHPKINKETVQKIEGLEDQNVNVQAIFNDARENPFSE